MKARSESASLALVVAFLTWIAAVAAVNTFTPAAVNTAVHIYVVRIDGPSTGLHAVAFAYQPTGAPRILRNAQITGQITGTGLTIAVTADADSVHCVIYDTVGDIIDSEGGGSGTIALCDSRHRQ